MHKGIGDLARFTGMDREEGSGAVMGWADEIKVSENLLRVV